MVKSYKEYLNDRFWKWFGNSKMVDDNGNPLVCYHGTNKNFTEFSSDVVGSSNDEGYYGKGFYFTFGNDKYSADEASYYGSKIMAVYLKVENPFDFSKLTEYKGHGIMSLGLSSMVFLYNIALQFPEVKIVINKTTWNNDQGSVEKIPISVLPKLVKKYRKDLKIVNKYRGSNGEEYITGYVKSEVINYDYTKGGGKKGSYVSYDELGQWNSNLSKEELEIGLIFAAIKKYDGIDANYHPEGYMTRYPEITEAIKKRGHDGIVQSMYGDEVVVFNAEQIKSATNNNGDFNPHSRNINEKFKLFETFKSQKEIELLANEVIRICGDLTYDAILTYLAFKKRNGVENVDTPVTYFPSVYLNEHIGNTERLKKYDELKDFILNSKVHISIDKFNKDFHHGAGSFIPAYHEVCARYSEKFIDDLNTNFKENRIKNGGDIYFYLYYEVNSTLLHEIQHAYDHYRSNGKAFKSLTNSYNKNKKEADRLRIKYNNGEKITDDEIDIINKNSVEYKHQKHEVDARFTQAIKEIRPYKRDENNLKITVLTDWDDYFNSFKLKFDGWRELSDNDKKRLIRKLSQFYEYERDALKQKNTK